MLKKTSMGSDLVDGDHGDVIGLDQCSFRDEEIPGLPVNRTADGTVFHLEFGIDDGGLVSFDNRCKRAGIRLSCVVVALGNKSLLEEFFGTFRVE